MVEKSLVNKFIDYFRSRQLSNVWFRKNYVVRSTRFFPRQPEIDLIYALKGDSSRGLQVFAAEVKYIRLTKDRQASHSYYEGLDEALALLILGFDRALLIHLIDSELLETVLLKAIKLLSMLVEYMRLPIGYRVYSVSKHGAAVSFYTWIGRGNTYIDLKELWADPPPNPLLSADNPLYKLVKSNRDLLIDTLGLHESSD
jgi:hypothetical protein